MAGLGTPGGLDADFASLGKHERYKILCGLVIPRPIAWVTTIGEPGRVNAAPFSFEPLAKLPYEQIFLAVFWRAIDGTGATPGGIM